MKRFNIGVIGLGKRGVNIIYDTLLKMPHVNVCCVSDVCEDRVERVCQRLKSEGHTTIGSVNYTDFLHLSNLDAVFIATPWQTHISISIEFLKAGVPVGMEVGGASSIKELWQLVDTVEQSGTFFMFMENCCYDKAELLATSMVRHGLLGEIVHCSGKYGHDLRHEVATGKENRHYRLHHYLTENKENYPTHELGPIARLLNINRGNRMLSLVSVASKALGMEEYVRCNANTVNPELIGRRFMQGDIVDTIITCENGETIHIKLDTTLPRSYSRDFVVQGTKGMYSQDLNLVFLDGDEECYDTLDFNIRNINNAEKHNSLLPSFWQSITKEQMQSGHGGMDGFMLDAFVNCITNNLPSPINVYDAVAWMSITCLSEQSIKNNGMPVYIPDFTRGQYKSTPPSDVVKLK